VTAGGDEMDVQAAVSSNAAASSSWIRILRTILLRKRVFSPLTILRATVATGRERLPGHPPRR